MSNLHKVVALMFAAALSQNIYALHGEYFWNNDPGIDRATTISVIDSDGDGYYDISFPTANIPEGLNLLGFRVRYSNCWSTTTTALVWIPAENSDEVLASEYFFDTDPGIGMANPIPGLTGHAARLTETVIPTDGLATGIHLLGIRVKGAAGWSTTTTALVCIPAEKSNEILASEYFFDTDPGIGMANPIPGLTGHAARLTETVIPTDGLTPGIHLLGIRVKGAAGWSTTTTTTVKIVDNKLMSVTAAEYYWSTDPDKTTAIPITPGREVEISDLAIQFPEQEAEEYTLYFMAKTGEQWYQVYSNTFVNVPLTAIVLNEETLELNIGESANLTVTTEPDAALFTDYELTSADETIARVNPDGCVDAVTEGETIIIATSKRYPDINATCKVTVHKNLTGITSAIAGQLSAHGVAGGIIVNSECGDVKIYNSTGVCIKEPGKCDNIFVAAAPGVYFVSSGNNVIKVITNP